eukprot:2848941-Alexandrium_andersonii.AAC.1
MGKGVGRTGERAAPGHRREHPPRGRPPPHGHPDKRSQSGATVGAGEAEAQGARQQAPRRGSRGERRGSVGNVEVGNVVVEG